MTQGFADGFEEAAALGGHGLFLIMIGDQIAEHLGVSFRLKRVPLGQEEFFRTGIIFHHAVVNQGNFPVAAKVGVGIGIRHATVRGPARVPDTGRTGDFLGGGALNQSVDPARFFS